MFTTRLMSGIVLVILAVLIVGTGGALLFAVTAALSLIGMFELYRVVEIEKKAPGIAGYAAGIFYYVLLWLHRENYVVLMAIAALMVLMAIYVVTFPHYRTEQVTVAFFGIFYLAVMLSYLYQVRAMTDGKYLVWLIVLSSWGCDTCAYCVGMLFGKHKLTPLLSPEEDSRGSGRRRPGGSAAGSDFWSGVWLPDGGDCQSACSLCHCLRHCSCDLTDRRFGCLCHQEKPQCERLRPSDSGTRRRARSV